jgi:hypothetical protein
MGEGGERGKRRKRSQKKIAIETLPHKAFDN